MTDITVVSQPVIVEVSPQVFEVTVSSVGAQGAAGVGVPSGGTTGKVLAKKSNTDYDTEWVNAATGTGTVTNVTGTAPINVATGTTTPVVSLDQTALSIQPNQVAGTAVVTSDSRLSNARTPTAHATTHGVSGSDAITIAQSQVTNLVSDLSAKIPSTQKGVANGVASLDADAKVPANQLPPLVITDTFVVTNKADLTSLTLAEQGDIGIVSNESKSYILKQDPYSTLTNWEWLQTPASGITSIVADSPLTGGTITTSGQHIGLDQTALTIANNQVSGLGTASTKNVPATGDASGTQVVLGSDSRLTNSRTPTAHASTHDVAGSDPITIASIQISDKGSANGLATLDGSSKLTSTQLPTSVVTTSTTSLSNVTSVNSTTIPANSTLIVNTDSRLTGITALATAWNGNGGSYVVGDVVTYQQSYYVCRVAHTTSTGSPLITNTTYWSQRTPTASLNGAPLSPTGVVGHYNNGIGVTGIGVSNSGSLPATGISVNNGSVTVSGTGNGVTVTGTGGVNAGSGGVTTTGSVTANTFSGSGASLTSIPAGSLTGQVQPTNGGTGVNNAGTLALPNANALTLTTSGTTNATLPSGNYTIARTADVPAPREPNFLSGNFYRPALSQNTAAVSATGNTFYYPFYVGQTTTFDRICALTGGAVTTAGNVRLGIYNDLNGYPTTVVLDAGQVAFSAVSTSYTLGSQIVASGSGSNGTTVTYTTSTAHGLLAGQTVTITGFGIASGSSLNLANVQIASVTSTTFTINNGTIGTTSGQGTANIVPVSGSGSTFGTVTLSQGWYWLAANQQSGAAQWAGVSSNVTSGYQRMLNATSNSVVIGYNQSGVTGAFATAPNNLSGRAGEAASIMAYLRAA